MCVAKKRCEGRGTQDEGRKAKGGSKECGHVIHTSPVRIMCTQHLKREAALHGCHSVSIHSPLDCFRLRTPEDCYCVHSLWQVVASHPKVVVLVAHTHIMGGTAVLACWPFRGRLVSTPTGFVLPPAPAPQGLHT
jgi:hypothetical protein